MSNCGKAFSGWAWIQGLTNQQHRPRRRKQSTAMQTEALEDRVMLSAAAVGSVDTQAVDLGGNLPTFSEFDAGKDGMATVDTSTDGDPIRGEKDQPVSKGESTDGDPIRGEKDQPVSKGESTDGDPIRGEKDQPVSGAQPNLKSADDVGFNPQPQPPGNDWIIAGNPSLQKQPGADGFWVAPSPETAAVVELSNQIDAASGDNMNQLGDIKGEATDEEHLVGSKGIDGEARDTGHKDWINFESHPGYPSIAGDRSRASGVSTRCAASSTS